MGTPKKNTRPTITKKAKHKKSASVETAYQDDKNDSYTIPKYQAGGLSPVAKWLLGGKTI